MAAALFVGVAHGCNVSSEGDYRVEPRGGSGGASGQPGSSGAGAGANPGSSYGGATSVGATTGQGGAAGSVASGGSTPEPMPQAGSAGAEDAGGAPGEPPAEDLGGAAGMQNAEDLSGAEAGAPPVPACEVEGAVRCRAEGEPQREACESGEWVEGTSCAAGETCDASDGTCGLIVAECVGRHSAERYCSNNTLVACAADLLDRASTPCDGQCVEAGGSADCAPPGCGDGIRQDGEACDDANATSGDGCSQACRWEAVSVFAGGQQSCALSSSGVLRCWGDNSSGELGLGNKLSRGSKAAELGSALPGPDLGAHTVKEVSLGLSHTCAILDDDTLRCWGSNALGRLGHGDEVARGDDSGEMGSALPVTELGGSGLVSDVAAGEGHSCALLSGGRVKCWGDNAHGQLGVGNLDPLGDAMTEKGEALPAVELGPGRTAKQVAVGVGHSCAVLDPDTVKCWGDNTRGQLGQGDKDARGDEEGEMSELRPVELGDGAVVLQVVAGAVHTCALLKGGAVKCWGGNDLGQLGLGNKLDRGDEPGEMGTALAAVNLGRNTLALSAGFNHTCALLDDDTIKCWGGNGLGQLGQGDTNHRGDASDELGVQLPAVDLGMGRTARSVAAGRAHTCALLDDGAVRCWGNNVSGQLGSGNPNAYGNAMGTMGAALVPVNLEF